MTTARAGDTHEPRLPERDELDAVIARLGPDDRGAMLDDLLDAVWESKDASDVGAVIAVVHAWFVDTQVVSRPGFSERLAEAGGRVVTREELLSRAES